MEKFKAMQQEPFSTARTLSQALPYLQRYDKAIIVIKLGGHAMSDSKAISNFARDVVLMKQCNVNPIIIHGGGPMINNFLKKMNIETAFVDGKRVTDTETIDIIEMILCGHVNKNLVSAINFQGGKAVGLSGKDANLMTCTPDQPKFGMVGKPSNINPAILKNFIESDFIPVIAPIGIGLDKKTYNVNADTVAGAIASSMKADRLLLLTDVPGVKNRQGELLSKLSVQEVKILLKDGTIKGGMIPKASTAVEAVEKGVRAVVVLDGRAQNACLLELFTEHGIGTLIKL